MTLRELSKEYYDVAEEIKRRAADVRELSRARGICEMERFRLRCRADRLTSMWREMRGVARYLEAYYLEANGDIVE